MTAQKTPARIGPGDRGIQVKVQQLQRLHREGKLRYVTQQAPDETTGAPRYYVVEVRGEQVALTGQQVTVWVAGFDAGYASAGPVPTALSITGR